MGTLESKCCGLKIPYIVSGTTWANSTFGFDGDGFYLDRCIGWEVPELIKVNFCPCCGKRIT